MSRRIAFAVVVTAALAVAAAYVAWSLQSRAGQVSAPDVTAAGPSRDVSGIGNNFVLFTDLNYSNYGPTSRVIADAPQERAIVGPPCDRLHFGGGRGLCLMPIEAGIGFQYHAMILDARLAVRDRLRLPGILSRARVSADGRYGAATGFVTGHSYADRGFSTATLLMNLRTGKRIGNLEQFSVLKDGKPVDSPDFNFWGVTFHHDDSDRFYATLATRGKIYLVTGSIAERQVRVLVSDIECPSLSPDDSRIAFKQPIGRGSWRLSVLDLKTLRRTKLAETRSVDDQVEWLDSNTILYGFNRSIWSVPADGSGSPNVYLEQAVSPAVVATDDEGTVDPAS